ncbi:hypothetical protein GCM10011346_15500 [Oceanobacillus neutriphilus]|uniref:Uncharacterized protein n=1 Tax=Oceanobacillus neutriphilus TaxID=531815 RepID=A0ABQ2NT85_9BACI|nr:hypothetical protein GCM10011346_15500 [Oceanobacillus neutriphilus]
MYTKKQTCKHYAEILEKIGEYVYPGNIDFKLYYVHSIRNSLIECSYVCVLLF